MRAKVYIHERAHSNGKSYFSCPIPDLNMAPPVHIVAVTALLASIVSAWNPWERKTVTITRTEDHTKYITKTRSYAVSGTCAPSTTGSGPPVYPTKPSSPKSQWPGWAGISHMVVFGDSYTTTGFNDTLAQPNESNPLGNPVYPGYTATNGPNWVDFLTTTYNKTFLETINLAYGGATIDSALVAPYLPTVLSVKEQVNAEFLPVYGSSPSFFPWKSDDTLFATFIGINDVGNAYQEANKSAIYPKEFVEYAALQDQLYQAGARNFLFLNVPPVDRSPLTAGQGAAAQASEKADIAAWDANVTALAANLTETYSDATTFVFDTNALFTQVLDDPASHVETAPYRNTTDYCESCKSCSVAVRYMGQALTSRADMNGTPSWYTFYQNCSIPVDEYFWLNSLHPTFRMMNVTAQEIARQLG